MLIRNLPLGLAAALVAACAQMPAAGPETPAQPQVTQAPAATPVQILEAPAPLPAPAQAQSPAPPLPPTDVWQRVRAGFRLPTLDGALVQRQEQWYLANPDYLARMVERSSHFLYHIVEEIERRKMPTEIALLPMIESAYNPQAYSRAHASGMWQFIPSTGKIYGLRQNFWYDGRRDVLAATGAALDYLEKLYNQFGDWTLALAAYNWGEGAVSRAVAKNQAKGLPTNYESLAMPLETRTYVPKLQAVKNIIANPGQYGINLAVVPNRPYFATVTTNRHIDVQLVAALAEMPLEEFRFLNPAHNKPVIKADGSEAIVLPIDRVAIFQRNLDTHDRPLVSWQAYTVKRNDQPEKLAAKHGMTLAQLNEVNGVTAKKKIVAGQTILVPLRGDAAPHLPDLPAPKIVLARGKPRKAACYVVSSSGTKKKVQCAPAKSKQPATVAAKQRSKPATPSAGVSIRALTGG